MNYINQINAFREKASATEGMTSTIISLYYALLGVANDTGWKPVFEVYRDSILDDSKNSYKTYLKNREFLAENGFIKFNEGAHCRRKASFQMVCLYSSEQGRERGNFTQQHGQQAVENSLHNPKPLKSNREETRENSNFEKKEKREEAYTETESSTEQIAKTTYKKIIPHRADKKFNSKQLKIFVRKIQNEIQSTDHAATVEAVQNFFDKLPKSEMKPTKFKFSLFNYNFENLFDHAQQPNTNQNATRNRAKTSTTYRNDVSRGRSWSERIDSIKTDFIHKRTDGSLERFFIPSKK